MVDTDNLTATNNFVVRNGELPQTGNIVSADQVYVGSSNGDNATYTQNGGTVEATTTTDCALLL